MLTTFLVVFFLKGYSQVPVHDQANIYQEERMVFKQWDRNKFIPAFHLLKPKSWYLYSLTWLLENSYKQGADLRPLRAGGEQTQRLALAAAMTTTTNHYKKETDTLRNTALTEFINYSGTVSAADPLYILYYKRQLAPLRNPEAALLQTPPNVNQFLIANGSYSAYLLEIQSLLERFNNAKKVDLDRGQRILLYHRILLEYRKIATIWNQKIKEAELILSYRQSVIKKNDLINGGISTLKTDQQIEHAEIERYKLRNR